MTGPSYSNLSQLEDTVALHGCRHTLSRGYLIFIHPNLELSFPQNQHGKFVTHIFVVLDALVVTTGNLHQCRTAHTQKTALVTT
jgi:hypothetical protein